MWLIIRSVLKLNHVSKRGPGVSNQAEWTALVEIDVYWIKAISLALFKVDYLQALSLCIPNAIK